MPALSVKSARVELQLTQKQLASILDVDRKTVGRWEQGHGRPKESHLLDLRRMLKAFRSAR